MLVAIKEISDWVEEGKKHGIPVCCGVRFGLTRVLRLRYRIDSLLQPTPLHGLADRIQALTPRHAHAAHTNLGYVPCEAHLAWWLATGKMPDIKQD